MNCRQYNGDNSNLTVTALAIVQNCREYLAGVRFTQYMLDMLTELRTDDMVGSC